MTATPVPPTLHPTRINSPVFLWTFGVIFPLAAIAFEWWTAICTTFIDPMPTPWHLALLFAVPACNFLAWRGLRRDSLQNSRLFAALTGFSAMVALFYTILFVPVMPIALVGLIVLLPILAFTPVLALWTAIRLMRAWAGLAGARPIILGAACGLAALALPALPVIGVRTAAGMVASPRSWVRETGFAFLRLEPVRQQLSEDCDPPSTGGAGQAVGLLTGHDRLAPEDARRLYYRATGKPYEHEPVSNWRHTPWTPFDAARGGNRIGRPTKSIQVSASRIDGVLDARSAVGYFEWTLVFHNTSGVQQEARTELALPQGAVVSRVTLWIDGAEREAAFGERGQVRQAYQSVVQARRDPLLVTSSGRDRVLVQCFPIPPEGNMKIRIGITAPILPEGLTDTGVVVPPALVAQNFDTVEPASVWIESKGALAPASGKFTTRIREDGVSILQGEYPAGEPAAVRLTGLDWGQTWTPATPGDTERAVSQRFVARQIEAPERVVVVVDGSESMRAMQSDIGATLNVIPPQVEKRVIVATRTGIANWPPAMPWRGGVDPIPALQAAVSTPSDARRTTVLWIAGEQPVRMSSAEAIRQILERDPERVRLLVLPGSGENVALQDLDGLSNVETIPRLGGVAEDLRLLFDQWRPGQQERIAERQLLRLGAPATAARRGSSHIARLWAAGEVARLAATSVPDAAALAVEHRIVTPVQRRSRARDRRSIPAECPAATIRPHPHDHPRTRHLDPGGARVRSARTPACRVETHLDALFNIPAPHCSTVSHRHRVVSRSSRSFMLWIWAIRSPNSAIFPAAIFRHRAEIGVDSRKPKNNCRTSSRLKPTSCARLTTANRYTVASSYRRCPLTRRAGGSTPRCS